MNGEKWPHVHKGKWRQVNIPVPWVAFETGTPGIEVAAGSKRMLVPLLGRPDLGGAELAFCFELDLPIQSGISLLCLKVHMSLAQALW